MKLFEFYESSPSYVDDELTSYVSMGEWYENAVKEYREKGLEALFQYISRTKSGKLAGKDIQTIKHDFESDRDQYETEEAAVAEFLDFLNNIPEGKNKSKQNNPVAKHSRNMPGAGAHKSSKDYDRKDAKKEIEKDLEDDDYIDNRNMGHPDGVTSDEEDKLHGRIHKIREKSDAMIGEPDAYYDAEQRQEAHDDLEDALQGNYMDSYIKDGSCPACAGNGYMDGEEEVYNDETEEYEEGTECDGFGNYGCDEGEMTYGSDSPSWVEIIKHDKRQKDREEQLANRPSDEELIPKVANMMKNMDDPRMAVRQVRIDYGYGPAKASDIVGKAFELLKQDEGLQFDEGTRCWKGYEKKGTKKMFGKTVPNCVKKENTGNPHKGKYVIKTDEPGRKDSDIVIVPDEKSANDMVSSLSKKKPNVNYWVEIVEKIDKDTPCPACGDPKCDHKEDHINEDSLDGYYLAHRAKKLWLGDNPGKTERDYWQAGKGVHDEYGEKAGGKKTTSMSSTGKAMDTWHTENISEGEERSIITDACVEKLVDEFSGKENQFANKDDFEYAIYQRLEDLDVEDCVDPDMEVGGQRIGDFASGRVIDVCSSSSIIYDVMAHMDETQIGEGKSPHKKGTAKYKKHMAAMHAEDVGADSSEADVSKMLAKALGDPNRWTEMSAPELYAELESRDTEFADAIKQVARIVYGVKLEETITTISK